MSAIRLPRKIEARLTRLAKRIGRSTASIVREAILKHLEDREDLYLAEQIKRRIDSGEEATFTLEEVEARFGLADL